MATEQATSVPLFLDGISLSSLAARQDLAAFISGPDDTSGIRAIAGVKATPGAAGLKVAAAGSMNLTVGAGQLVIQSTSSTTGGVYVVTLPNSATLTVTTADPSLARIDRVVARVIDNGDGTSTYKVQLLAGTPSASPSAPAIPNDGFSLATIAVGAGVTSIVSGNITDTRTYFAMYTGIQPVTTFPTNTHNGQAFWHQTEKQLYISDGSGVYANKGAFPCTSSTHPTNKLQGMLIYETDTGTVLVWSGSAWDVVVDTQPIAYTPVWSNSGGAPASAVGNGTIVGEYQRQGKMIDVTIKLTCGSTSFAGTGTQYWSLPIAPAVSTFAADFGTWVVSDSGGSSRSGPLQYVSGPKVAALYHFYSAGEIVLNAVTSTAPLIWNTNDYIVIQARYRIA